MTHPASAYRLNTYSAEHPFDKISDLASGYIETGERDREIIVIRVINDLLRLGSASAYLYPTVLPMVSELLREQDGAA